MGRQHVRERHAHGAGLMRPAVGTLRQMGSNPVTTRACTTTLYTRNLSLVQHVCQLAILRSTVEVVSQLVLHGVWVVFVTMWRLRVSM